MNRIVVPAQTLIEVCSNLGMDSPQLEDDSYQLLDMDWFQSIIPAIRKRVKADVGTYEAGSSDCDDFASCAYEEVKRQFRKWRGKVRGSTVAFGKELAIPGDVTRQHKINVFFTGSSESPKDISIGFYEPQNGTLLDMSKQDLSWFGPPQFD